MVYESKYKIFLILLYTSLVGAQQEPFRLGVELFSASLASSLNGGDPLNVGLITNQTGKDQQGNRTLDILIARGIQVKCIFAPEHGFQGIIPASHDVPHMQDEKTGVPIVSLYRLCSGKKIDIELLHGLDALVFDIQDSGMRHYTYISTLFNALQTAAQTDKIMIVLDRPNPLGMIMEGPLVDQSLKSFISIAQIPLRHGMTVGELARYFNKWVLESPARLCVVPMKNYDRTHGITKLAWTGLSPNIACIDSCYGYSMGGLLGEVAPFEVGVGTTDAFKRVMIPEKYSISRIEWHELTKQLKKYGINAYFERLFHKRKKQWYHGIHLSISNINQVRAFDAFIAVVTFARKNKVPISFSKLFDKAAGSSLVKDFLIGHISRKVLDASVSKQLKDFEERIKDLLYYTPAPIALLRNASR